MSRASALLAGLTALVLVLVVGNPGVNESLVERLAEQANRSRPSLTLTSTRFLSWEVPGTGSDRWVPMLVQAVVFVVLAAVLGGLAGRATRVAGLIGGFGAGVAAAIVASTIATLVADESFVAIGPSPSLLDRLSIGIAGGTFPGLLPALPVAVAVAVGARAPARRTTAAADGVVNHQPPPGPSYPPAALEPTQVVEQPMRAPGDETRNWRPSSEVEEALREADASSPEPGPAIGAPPPRTGASPAGPSAANPDDGDDPGATPQLPPSV